MSKTTRTIVVRYGAAVAGMALATAVQASLAPVLQDRFPFATLFFAVLAAAWFGGFGPALVATLLGAAASVVLLLPEPSATASSFPFMGGLILYLCVGGGIAALGGRMRAAQDAAEAAAEKASKDRAALVESEARYRRIVETAHEGVWLIDADARTSFVNGRTAAILGCSVEDLQARPVLDFVFEEDQAERKRLFEDRKKGLRGDLDLRYRRVDGGEVWLHVSAVPLFEEGVYQGALALLTDVSERRRMERELQEQREWFETTLSSVGDAVVATDVDGRVRFLNPVACGLTGWSLSEAAGQPLAAVFRIVDEASRRAVESPVEKALREGTVVGLANHTILIAKDGVERPIEDSAAPIRDAKGAVVGVVLVFRDATERRRAEEAARAWERHLQLVADSAPVFLAHVDQEQRYKFVNKRYAQRFGLDPHELVGKTILEVVGEEAAATIAPYVAAALRGERVEYEVEIPYRKIGRLWMHCTYEPEIDAAGRVVGYVGAIRDVTESRRVAQALREVEARFAAVVDHTPACVFAKDREGKYILANRALARLLGRSPEDFPGKTDRDFFPPETAERFARDDAAVVESGRPLTYEESFLHEGVLRTYLTVKFPLRDETGAAYAACAVAADVTDLKRTQAELQSTAERLKLALSAARLGDWSWDAATDLVTFSDRGAEIFGIPPGPFMPWTRMQELIVEEDREATRRAVERSVAERTPYDAEYRVRRPDGTLVWVSAMGRAHYGPSGEPLGMFGVVQDVGERKASEEALREEARTTAVLHRIGRTLAAELDLEQIVQIVTDEATSLTEAQFGAFFYNVLNERGEAYTLYTISGVPRAAFEKFPMPRNTALFEPTFRGAGVVRIHDVLKDPRYGRSAPYHGMPSGHLPVRSYLAAPVVARSGEVLGGLFFGHSEPGVFTERHERLVVGVAAQAAVAIDNARLYGQAKAAEARLAAIVEHSPAAIFMKDLQGRYQLVNRRFEEFARAHGGAGPYLGRTDDEVFPPEKAAKRKAEEERVAASKQSRTLEESTTIDGVRSTRLQTGFPLLDDAGEVYALGGVDLDITGRVQAEEALRGSEERLRLALEAGRMGVWEWDVSTNKVVWSETLEPLHGLAPGEFGGTLEEVRAFVHPEDRALVDEALGRSLREGAAYDVEFRIVWPDGSVHWTAGKGKVHVEEGRPARMIGVCMDVTARKRTEQDMRFLADASATLAGLVDYDSTLQKVARLAAPTFADWAMVDVLDDSGTLRRVAAAHVDPAKMEFARKFHRRHPSSPDSDHGAWKVLRTGRSELVPEIDAATLASAAMDDERRELVRKLGLKSYLAVPLRVRGKVLGVISFVAAESGRRYSEADLHVAEDLANRAAVAIENARLYQEVREADRRKDEFLAVLGHELRNPLAPISSALQVLKSPQADARIAAQARDIMERQVQHMVRLVDDLLDVSRIVRGKVELRREPLELAAVAARAVESAQPLIDAERHELTVSLPPEPLRVHGDMVRLAQVLGNLLNNAARYTERGGRIQVEASREGDRAVVRVRDSGIGIDPEVLPRIWEMFVQADRRTKGSHGGMGIGLALVKGLVEMHGGSVLARSAGRGQGSEFVVSLPLLAENGLPAETSGEGPTPRGAQRSVLVVDDNVDAAESLAMLLRLGGHRVQVAHDGPAALRLAESSPPDLAFFDIGMPVMDGYELARAFRSQPRLKEVPLVALTGWGQEEDRRRTKEAGFDHHLVKPVEPDALDRIFASPPAE